MDNYSRRSVNKERHYYGRKAITMRRQLGKLRGSVVLLVAVAGIGVVCIGGALALGAYNSVIDSAPSVETMNVTPTSYATFVYDNEGNQTAKLVQANSNRIPVTLDQVPENLQHAFVAVEDERFYEHSGIDIQGILRAGIQGITSGSFSQGASTITQQLIKNSVFTDFTEESFSDSVRRKIQEQYLAVQLEEEMSKDDILINYLNTINLGHNTLGVQAASLRYFGKNVAQLNLSECAVIAGITQNPSAYDPIVYPENNAVRRKVVLDDMLEQGWITQDEYDKAIADNPYARIQEYEASIDEDEDVNSYFVDALTDQILEDLQDDLGYTQTQAETLLYSGGLKIYSTQDMDIQAIVDEEANNEDNYPAGTKWYLTYQLTVQDSEGNTANYSTEMMQTWRKENGLGSTMLFSTQEAADEMIERYKEAVLQDGYTVIAEKKNLTAQPQISMTIEDQHTGEVVAMVGGRGDKTASRTLNRATDSMRQPGSTFKVVAAYAAALDAGDKTLGTVYIDEPYSFEDGTPVRNWYSSYRGASTIRTAIQNSMNIIAVKTLTDITPELGFKYLENFGFTTLIESETINGQVFSDVQQTLALGGLTYGVKNIELNGAYATIANGGEYLEPKLYSKVTDHDGKVILDASKVRETRQVLREETAWLLTSAMEDVVTKGTGTRCRISETPVAGKTGTTNDENDVWFAGYTQYYCATTWAGYDENTNLYGSESNIAKTLWHNVMERVHEGYESKEFEMPEGIIRTSICSVTGLKPVSGLCSITYDYFDESTYPTESCSSAAHNEVYSKGIYSTSKGYVSSGTGTGTGTTTTPQQNYDGMSDTGENVGLVTDPTGLVTDPNAGAGAGTGAGTGTVSTGTSAAQAQLDSANATLGQAASILQQAQGSLAAAQASGDAAAIAQAQAIVDIATTNYNTGVAQVQAAQAAVAAGQ